MKKYIWQSPDYPHFSYVEESLGSLLEQIKYEQGILAGCMGIHKDSAKFALLDTYCEDVVRSSAIEGIRLNLAEVRSSFARRLGLKIGNNVQPDEQVEGLADVMMDAVRNYALPLTHERLWAWHSAMFPDGYSGLYKIRAGSYRDDSQGPMQVVSGPLGHETVFYQAPPAGQVVREMDAFLDYVNNSRENILLKAGIAHLWFVIIHPFDDGNGRIARIITDMLLCRSEDSPNRYYSMSAQINRVRKDYYGLLELTGDGDLDVTEWLRWFLQNILLAIEEALQQSKQRSKKLLFWRKMDALSLNQRQRKVLRKLGDGFEGKLTTTKWGKICSCSQDTAARDIVGLMALGVLAKQGKGRGTYYILQEEEDGEI